MLTPTKHTVAPAVAQAMLATQDGDEPQPSPPPDTAPAENPPPPPASVEPNEPLGNAGDEKPEDSGAEDDPAKSESPDAEPEGVRRKQPSNPAEEREYKKRKLQEDPFSNVAPAHAVQGAYNPADWLRLQVTPGFTRYMAQDSTGKVLGYHTIHTSLEENALLGSFVHLTQAADYPPRRKTDCWLFADTLKPRRVLQTQLDADEADPVSAYRDQLAADYLFDRLTIIHEDERVSTREQMRLLPYTFDRAQIPLLLTQLQFVHGEWPFECAIVDPALKKTLPMKVSKPKVVNVTAADGVSYGCYELEVSLGDSKSVWWVLRASPNRLVKYKEDKLTCTLVDFR